MCLPQFLASVYVSSRLNPCGIVQELLHVIAQVIFHLGRVNDGLTGVFDNDYVPA